MGRGGLAARLGSAPLPSSRRCRDWGREPGAGMGEVAPSRRRHSRGAAPDGADPAATALRGALKWRPRCLCPARAAPKGRGVVVWCGVCPTLLPEISHHSLKGCSRPQAHWGVALLAPQKRGGCDFRVVPTQEKHKHRQLCGEAGAQLTGQSGAAGVRCLCLRSTAVILCGYGGKLSPGFARQSPGCHSRLTLLKINK